MSNLPVYYFYFIIMLPVPLSSPFFASVTSFFQEQVGSVFSAYQKPTIGDLWQAEEAAAAFREGVIRSLFVDDDDDDNDDDIDNSVSKTGSSSNDNDSDSDSDSNESDNLSILFRNETPVTLILCWVSQNGCLHHFYTLPSSTTAVDRNIVIDIGNGHMEYSSPGHAFCLVYVKNDNDIKSIQNSRLPVVEPTATVIAGFRPFLSSTSSSERTEHNERTIQLVTISHVKSLSARLRPPSWCLGKRQREPRDGNDDVNSVTILPSLDTKGFRCTARWVQSQDSSPLDTTTKLYKEIVLGDWPCRIEPNCFDNDTISEQKFERDMKIAGRLLPAHARQFLQRRCTVWINKSLTLGTKYRPVIGRGCCYHPSRQWLLQNGSCGDKHKCVEIYDAPSYRTDCDLWAPGGVMLHELSHAYHHGMIADGYSNSEIQHCYDLAMEEGLYDYVKVHGPQGPKAPAYACTNSMEYFAELSTAFLGGLDGEKEFNKWYPFNRKDIAEHDPRAYELLTRLWKVDMKTGKR